MFLKGASFTVKLGPPRWAGLCITTSLMKYNKSEKENTFVLEIFDILGFPDFSRISPGFSQISPDFSRILKNPGKSGKPKISNI